METPNKTYWTIEEAAEQISLGKTKTRELAKAAGAEKKIGKSYRIVAAKLLEYVESL